MKTFGINVGEFYEYRLAGVFGFVHHIVFWSFLLIWFVGALMLGGMVYRGEVEFWDELIKAFNLPFVEGTYFNRDGSFNWFGLWLGPCIWPLPVAITVIRTFFEAKFCIIPPLDIEDTPYEVKYFRRCPAIKRLYFTTLTILIIGNPLVIGCCFWLWFYWLGFNEFALWYAGFSILLSLLALNFGISKVYRQYLEHKLDLIAAYFLVLLHRKYPELQKFTKNQINEVLNDLSNWRHKIICPEIEYYLSEQIKYETKFHDSCKIIVNSIMNSHGKYRWDVFPLLKMPENGLPDDLLYVLALNYEAFGTISIKDLDELHLALKGEKEKCPSKRLQEYYLSDDIKDLNPKQKKTLESWV